MGGKISRERVPAELRRLAEVLEARLGAGAARANIAGAFFDRSPFGRSRSFPREGWMRRVFPWIAAGVFLAAFAASADEVMVDAIAAQVGDDVVLFSEVVEMVSAGESKMRASGIREEEIAKLRAQGLERMIEEKLIRGEIKRMELYASDTEIDETIAMIAKDNGLTAEQLKRSVLAKSMDFDDYRQEIKEKLEYQRVIQVALMPRVEVDEAEVRRLYDQRFKEQPDGGEQVHLRQLLVPIGPQKDAAAAARIAAGEAFEVVASEISAVAPQQGGDIGWLHATSLASWMAEIVATLEPGQVSPVNQQPFGCNLLKLVERKAFERVSYETAQPHLYREIQQMMMETEFTTWMEELRERTYIQRHGYFADAANLDANAEDPNAPEKGLLSQ
jgi:peptidyl-prolyl cis-trans isomerase SurA